MRAPLLALLSFVLLVQLPNRAEACACCDGGNERVVQGWSASGNSALVRRQELGCEDHLVDEIWRRGQAAPVGCFDLFSDRPDRRVDCSSELVYGFDRYPPDQRPEPNSPRAAAYTGTVTQLPSTHLRATLTPLDGGRERSPRVTLEVAILHGSTWRTVHTAALSLGNVEQYGSDPIREAPRSVVVRVWPNPSGEVALLDIQDDNSAPGMGYFGHTLSWIDLPTGLPTIAPSDEGAVIAMPALASHGRRRLARQVNRAGLRLHAAGEHFEAARVFASAALADPGNPVSLYNFACALARLGRHDRAFEVLEQIAARGCRQCAERIARALTDADLAPLRARVAALATASAP